MNSCMSLFNLSKGHETGDASRMESGIRPRKRRERSCNFGRIPKLLMLGYASEEAQRRYEMQRDWARLYTILMFKIENIGIVSGLLLASSCNLLIAGDLRRMTHAAVTASMFGSILSIVFGLLCRINITPARLQFLVTRTRLFYYLYATPSLWGGGAALAFFVAICSYTWLEDSTAIYGWEAKVSAIVLSGALIGNAMACFVLGACVTMAPSPSQQEEEKSASEEEERHDGPGLHSVGGLFGIADWGSNLRSAFDATPSTPVQRGTSRARTFDSSSGLFSPHHAHVRVPLRRQTAW